MHDHAAALVEISVLRNELLNAEERLAVLQEQSRELLVAQSEELHEYRKILNSSQIAIEHFSAIYAQTAAYLEGTPPWKWKIDLPFSNPAVPKSYPTELRQSAMTKVTSVGRKVTQWYRSNPRIVSRSLAKHGQFPTQPQSLRELYAEINQLREEISLVQMRSEDTRRLLNRKGYISTLIDVQRQYIELAVAYFYELLKVHDAPVAHYRGAVYTVDEIQRKRGRHFGEPA